MDLSEFGKKGPFLRTRVTAVFPSESGNDFGALGRACGSLWRENVGRWSYCFVNCVLALVQLGL